MEAGVTVVDLSDGGREYSAATLDTDPMLFMMMVIRFIRSNEESAIEKACVWLRPMQRDGRSSRGRRSFPNPTP